MYVHDAKKAQAERPPLRQTQPSQEGAPPGGAYFQQGRRRISKYAAFDVIKKRPLCRQEKDDARPGAADDKPRQNKMP